MLSAYILSGTTGIYQLGLNLVISIFSLSVLNIAASLFEIMTQDLCIVLLGNFISNK